MQGNPTFNPLNNCTGSACVPRRNLSRRVSLPLPERYDEDQRGAAAESRTGNESLCVT